MSAIVSVATTGITAKSLRDPTPEELESPLFNAIWAVIKGWDIGRESDGLYVGATGTDVCTIIDAIKSIERDTR